MSPKLPRLNATEVVKLLEKRGFEFDRQRGSHATYIHPDGRRATVPIHKSRTLGTGLLRQILKDADIDPDTLRR